MWRTELVPNATIAKADRTDKKHGHEILLPLVAMCSPKFWKISCSSIEM